MSQEKIQGGAMGGVDELYREVILDHFKSPKNKGRLAAPNAEAQGMNPLCGDQISMTALIENDQIKDLKFEGHGCAISQSAASMLTEATKGKKIQSVKELIQSYKEMFGINEGEHPPLKINLDSLGDLITLEGVKKYPVRVKCAVLSSNTLMQMLDEFSKKKGP